MDETKKLEEEKEEGVTLPPSEDEKKVEEKEISLTTEIEPTPEQVEDGAVSPEADQSNSEQSEDVVVQDEPVEPETNQGETIEQQNVEKMLTQSQVNDIVGKTRVETRDKTLSDIYNHYGVNDENGMDELFSKTQKYDMLHDKFAQVENELKEVKDRLAMVDSGIDPERYEDARLILKGKGLDITAENIANELETHPEWNKSEPVSTVASDVFEKAPDQAESSIVRLGGEAPERKEQGLDERDVAFNLFDLK